MQKRVELLQLLYQQIEQFPVEKERLQYFIDFVNNHEGQQLYDRKNFTGHITASAFIINHQRNSLLLLKHKALNRWLQPGGHVDVTDADLLASALREAEEETGIAAENLKPVCNIPFDFDSHFIPENKRRQELPHIHHDVRFLFIYSKTDSIILAANESTDSKWISFADLEKDAEFGEIVQKIQTLNTST